MDYVDLCGNYFQILPELPITVKTLRLSVTGGEDIKSLLNRLDQLTQLRNIHLELIAPGRDFVSFYEHFKWITAFWKYFSII